MIFIEQIIICLDKVFNEYGLEDYKNKWIEHEFPLSILEELKSILNEKKIK